MYRPLTGIGLLLAAMAMALMSSACSSPSGSAAGDEGGDVDTTAATSSSVERSASTADVELGSDEYGPAPVVPEGPLDPPLVADLDLVFSDLTAGFDFEAMRRIGSSGDPRVAWLISDLLRFLQGGESGAVLVESFQELTGATIEDDFAWGAVTNHLIAWDTPAPPEYVRWKRIPFEIIEPAWEPFFSDPDAGFDYRHLSWGGVLIDDRPLHVSYIPCPRGCIAAMTEPPTTDAAGGDWYDDDQIVFGVVVNGEARAYPKNQMEVHEMVNDSLGGRRVAIPYCTLCGSAQAYFTDELDDIEGLDIGVDAGRYEIRTSGLLSRSNKVMFEFQTRSAFDTFTGKAVSGPLREAGVHLPEITVETARWGDWKREYPETTIVTSTGVLGSPYPSDPLGGRDDEGPIFPIGTVDSRLETQAAVLGVVLGDGTAIAFDVEATISAIDDGDAVEFEGVVVTRGAGLRAHLLDGTELSVHQAFWFAWSQFHDTLLWDG